MSREPLVHPGRRPAWVTGASSGIGEATARALAAAGQPVVLGARRADRLEAIAAEIVDAGGEAAAIPLDLRDPGSVEHFVKSADTTFGPAEILVSNAGETHPTPVIETTPESFAAQLEVNVLGAQRLLALVVPRMVDRRRGDVVVVSSDVASVPRPRMAGYVTSKWALDGMAQALQMELEGTGVRASIVRPGPTATNMGSDWSDDDLLAVLEDWRRWGFARHSAYLPPSGVADAIVAIVSAPRGVHLSLVEVQPEAPLRRMEE